LSKRRRLCAYAGIGSGCPQRGGVAVEPFGSFDVDPLDQVGLITEARGASCPGRDIDGVFSIERPTAQKPNNQVRRLSAARHSLAGASADCWALRLCSGRLAQNAILVDPIRY
jgi:hypothetical protein